MSPSPQSRHDVLPWADPYIADLIAQAGPHEDSDLMQARYRPIRRYEFESKKTSLGATGTSSSVGSFTH